MRDCVRETWCRSLKRHEWQLKSLEGKITLSDFFSLDFFVILWSQSPHFSKTEVPSLRLRYVFKSLQSHIQPFLSLSRGCFWSPITVTGFICPFFLLSPNIYLEASPDTELRRLLQRHRQQSCELWGMRQPCKLLETSTRQNLLARGCRYTFTLHFFWHVPRTTAVCIQWRDSTLRTPATSQALATVCMNRNRCFFPWKQDSMLVCTHIFCLKGWNQQPAKCALSWEEQQARSLALGGWEVTA